jgi:hypothetical protein
MAHATRPFVVEGPVSGYAGRMADDEEARDDSGEDSGAQNAAKEQEREVEEAKEELHKLEEGDPPEDLEDWPSGRAKYLTYGGPEGTAGYDEGPTAKLGPSSLEHHEDGSVTIEGEEVDDPGEYKSDEPVRSEVDVEVNATDEPQESPDRPKSGEGDD